MRIVDEMIDKIITYIPYRRTRIYGTCTCFVTMLKLIIYGHMEINISQRGMEKACRRDINLETVYIYGAKIEAEQTGENVVYIGQEVVYGKMVMAFSQQKCISTT